MYISYECSIGSSGQKPQLVRMAVGLSAGQSIHYNFSASCSDRGISSLLSCICQLKGNKKKIKKCWNQRPLGLGLTSDSQMSQNLVHQM